MSAAAFFEAVLKKMYSIVIERQTHFTIQEGLELRLSSLSFNNPCLKSQINFEGL
jgi:hypothetical protein